MSRLAVRRGEVLGLRWRDVDLDAGRLAVRRTVISVVYAVHESDAKTDRSERVVDLDSRTVDLLRDHRARQAEERDAMGDGYRDHGLVFAKPEGSPFHPTSSARPSTVVWRPLAFRASAYMTSGTRTRPCSFRLASRPRS